MNEAQANAPKFLLQCLTGSGFSSLRYLVKLPGYDSIAAGPQIESLGVKIVRFNWFSICHRLQLVCCERLEKMPQTGFFLETAFSRVWKCRANLAVARIGSRRSLICFRLDVPSINPFRLDCLCTLLSPSYGVKNQDHRSS